jgi:HD superfamily phosphohydrolase
MVSKFPHKKVVTELDKTTFLAQLEEKYGERDDRKKAFKVEAEKVWLYFEAIAERLDENYVLEKVLAVGGTGIVLTGHHIRFNQPIVVKLNRPNAESEGESMVENEANILPTLTHPNIIGVLDLGRLCLHDSSICFCEQENPKCNHKKEECNVASKLTYIVEPFITNSRPFFSNDPANRKRTWLFEKVQALTTGLPATLELGRGDDTGQSSNLVNSLLDEIAKLFSQWTRMLRLIGTEGFIYLDVKPENVLVDSHLHLTAIDFGSVKRFDRSDQTPVDIFFTDQYAHPDLLKKIKEKPSSNRVRVGMKRSELRYEFDYYALGISMLEILNSVAEVRPHVIPQMPLYRSLHFLATRLLCGKNSKKNEDNVFVYASQIFPGLIDDDYENLAYENLDEVHRDIRKERGRWNLESEVPELATYSKDIVRAVPRFNTVLTPRLRGVIEHPLVARLKYVTQLGLVSLVYPTADHARYDHSLGSYTYTTYYIKSLFNDLGNPIFRNLVAADDINAVLLAALLHDLGQYPLAHDLEEVHKGIFRHKTIGVLLLGDPMLDSRGRTLMEIIKDSENGWGVDSDYLIGIWGASSKDGSIDERSEDATTKRTDPDDTFEEISFKTSVLAAIIDGQIDADKADYIIRDTIHCGLPYGAQLDIDRLLRVLTVAVLPDDDPKRRVALGVYDKGIVSAHAFGQARYQLLATVYWHHTARIIKAMLQYATAIALPKEVFNPEDDVSLPVVIQIRERLLQFIKSLVPPFSVSNVSEEELSPIANTSLDLVAKPTEEVINIIEDTEPNLHTGDENAWYPGISWTDWLMLRWIANLPDANSESSNLILGLQKRQLYKRVITLSHDENSALVSGLVRLTWPDRVKLCRKLHESVRRRLSRDWDKLDTATNMSDSDFDNLSRANLLIIIDIPDAGRKIGYDRPLGIVPELKDKSYQQDTRKAHDDKEWQSTIASMIRGISPVRVLCHPDVRNLVSSLYKPREIEKLIADGLKNLQ